MPFNCKNCGSSGKSVLDGKSISGCLTALIRRSPRETTERPPNSRFEVRHRLGVETRHALSSRMSEYTPRQASLGNSQGSVCGNPGRLFVVEGMTTEAEIVGLLSCRDKACLVSTDVPPDIDPTSGLICPPLLLCSMVYEKRRGQKYALTG